MRPSLVPSPAATPANTPSVAAKARFWNRVAHKYAADPIADLAGYEATLRRVQALLSPEQSVLEIGCGTGTTALRLAASTRRMLATDVSGEMIAIAHQKLALLTEPLPQLQFGVIDAKAPALYSDCHDGVLAFNVLHLVSDLDLALQAVLPTLKPGGCSSRRRPAWPR